MLQAFKYRLYLTKLQQRLLEQRLEERRWLFNHLPAERREAWERRKESLRYYDQATSMPLLKANRPTRLARIRRCFTASRYGLTWPSKRTFVA
jgi:hypothetical protein